MSNASIDAYQSVKTAMELWEAIDNKYMAGKEASLNNLLISQFNDYKMVNEHCVLD